MATEEFSECSDFRAQLNKCYRLRPRQNKDKGSSDTAAVIVVGKLTICLFVGWSGAGGRVDIKAIPIAIVTRSITEIAHWIGGEARFEKGSEYPD